MGSRELPVGRRPWALWSLVAGVAVAAAAVGAVVAVVLHGGSNDRVGTESVASGVSATPTSVSTASTGKAKETVPPVSVSAATTTTTTTTAAPMTTVPKTSIQLPLPAYTGLEDLTADPQVPGFVGPITLQDGTEVGVLTRRGRDVFDAGTVELAVRRPNGWHITRVLPGGLVTAPRVIGDLTGEGYSEIVVTMGGETAAKGFDVVYRLDDAGPDLLEIPFDLDAAGAILDDGIISLRVEGVEADSVQTVVTTCTPSCLMDPGRDLYWVLDTTGVSILRPVEPPADDGDQLAAVLPLGPGASGDAVAELQTLLQQAGIWVGPSGVDGSYGNDTAKAVSMIDGYPGGIPAAGPGADPSESGVLTTERLQLLRIAVEEAVPQVDGSSPCASTEQFVQSLTSGSGEIFRVGDLRCSSGWVTGILSEYDFADGLFVVLRIGDFGPTVIGGVYGGENGCAVYGVPVELWSFLGC